MNNTTTTGTPGVLIAESIKTEMCDNYCRYPWILPTQQELNAQCEKCPLNNPFGYSLQQE